MPRIVALLLCCTLAACKNGEAPGEKEPAAGFQFKKFTAAFKKADVPYSLNDTALLKGRDTTTILPADVASFVPDSIKKSFGKSAVKYVPLVWFQQKEKESYFIIKAGTTLKTIALLIVFDKDNNYGATLPFLIPDADPSTSQTSTVDKSFTVSKNIVQKSGTETTGEGKEVLAYDASKKGFTVILTDVLNETSATLVNPIDTFKGTGKFAGDYYLNKKNLVAIRDGRRLNLLLIYVHTENEAGDCKGELKGEALVTSASMAAYRLGGDPCVLGLSFAGNTVTLKEESGCGNHRDLDCPLAGTFSRKKAPKVKQPLKTGKTK